MKFISIQYLPVVGRSGVAFGDEVIFGFLAVLKEKDKRKRSYIRMNERFDWISV